MPYARAANVRSHRRGRPRPRRRRAVGPWLAAILAVALVGTGLAFGWSYLARHSCSGSARANIVSSVGTAPLLQSMAKRWQAGKPAIRGVCARVEITGKDSAVMAQALGTDWDEKSNGLRPDVWIPESTAWIRRASTAAIAERMMPDLQPSLARSPAIIAMPKPMAEALGWPNTKLTWQEVITKYAGPDGWKKLNKPWGDFRFGMTDPLKSTAGLLALMAILDGNDDGEVTSDEQASVLRLKQVRSIYVDSTAQIFDGLAKADAQGPDQALRFVSAFPAIEQDVLRYNQSNPKVPLVAIYPTNGSGEADHPYLVLDPPDADPQRQAVARLFLRYLRGADGRKAFLAAGFRDSNRAPGPGLTQINGFAAKVTTLPRAVLLPDSVKQSMDTWTALTRPTNVLLVLDVSGSMAQPVPGTGKTRLALAKEAARSAVSLFADDTQAGLWVFSTKLDAGRDYRSLVPLGKLSDQVGGRERKELMLASIDKLAPGGNTGLYDTMAAAQQAVLDNFKQGLTNLVVLMTDGKNDDDTGGLTLEQLTEKLTQNSRDAARRVPVVTVGYGEDADFATLQALSRITNAPSYTSKTSFDINQVLLTAIFGRV
jgi:Ca-activated chloride channel family protein